ncbi:alpha-ketoglutarate-dependent dioxygenase alkB homolog 7, mitochondrial [Esox lucius]|uniref:Alpha-ketoglutarate-dependent dioxygenase AlkB-like domain-containing protein n=1 Tax=Esox lucius TaxID=8010 RepID=A0A3P8ZGE7_ESOLU|nr:alpha-ketoglutarate-dependent dioxygenase alkB homolog 7, mitochondrial [Esox lucius]
MRLVIAVYRRMHTLPICSITSCGNPRSASSCSEAPTKNGLQYRDDQLVCGSNRELVQRLCGQVEVKTEFISKEEENALMKEIEPGLRKKRYEFDHWDDAIHGYRETERTQWGAVCEEVLSRLRDVAFPGGSLLLGPVHVLDLDKAGYIKPHIDSVKFCGSTIAGLSLLSDSVMRLVREDDPTEWLNLLLPRRSLYIIRDQARYKFTHEILKDAESLFSGQRVPRNRRISVICRNLPV